MNQRYARRYLIGALAGLVGGTILMATLGGQVLGLGLGGLVGIVYDLAVRPTRRAALDHVLTAAALGVPL